MMVSWLGRNGNVKAAEGTLLNAVERLSIVNLVLTKEGLLVLGHGGKRTTTPKWSQNAESRLNSTIDKNVKSC